MFCIPFSQFARQSPHRKSPERQGTGREGPDGQGPARQQTDRDTEQNGRGDTGRKLRKKKGAGFSASNIRGVSGKGG